MGNGGVEVRDGSWGVGGRETHTGTHNLIPVRWEAETGEPFFEEAH